MEYWHKQTIDMPLFENILWARPETRHGAGKLLVAGGNAHGFSVVGEAYATAEKAGAGTVRSLLPDALKKTIGPLGPYEFAPSTQSGGFGRDALNEFLLQANWADSVLLAGDLGRNSETSILLESFAKKYTGQLTLSKDAIDYFYNLPELIANRPQTVLVLNLGQLQRLGTALKFETPFLLSMGLVLLVQALHAFTEQFPELIVITKELDTVVVAYRGRVSSTKLPGTSEDLWQTQIAAKAAVLGMQNPGQPFEAITSSLVI